MEIIKNGIDGAEGYETRCSWGLGDKGWIGCGGPKAWILGFTKIMGLSEKKQGPMVLMKGFPSKNVVAVKT